ncbi:MAG: hypothetical protein K5647_05270, partial [Clostridiales bacterium]|nr:hypothetical protein [Clostridiales bacterium]
TASGIEETTAAPEAGTTGTPEVIATAPETTSTPVTDEKGCKSSAGFAAVHLIAAAAPVFFRKRK